MLTKMNVDYDEGVLFHLYSSTAERTITTVLTAGHLLGRVSLRERLFSLNADRWGIGVRSEKMLPSISPPLVIFWYEYKHYIASVGEVV